MYDQQFYNTIVELFWLFSTKGGLWQTASGRACLAGPQASEAYGEGFCLELRGQLLISMF